MSRWQYRFSLKCPNCTYIAWITLPSREGPQLPCPKCKFDKLDFSVEEVDTFAELVNHYFEEIMTKTEALRLIDDHKNKLTNPFDILQWTWLRVIILQISDDDWEKYVERAT